MTPHLELNGRVATIRLDAPERRNALGPADLRALQGVLETIDAHDDIDAVAIISSGTTFCSGYDLRVLQDEVGAGAASAAQGEFARVVDALAALRVPTVCALDGGAYGGGTDLALACDIRIGTPRASIALPAARLGLTFYSAGLRRYVERLGLDAAKRIFLLAETIGAEELLRLGFLHALVPEHELTARLHDTLARICANDGFAVGTLKRALNGIARGTADDAIIDEAFSESFRRPETLARLRGRFP